MVYNTQNYWVFELFPSSGILENRKHDVSETGSVSVLRWRGEKTPTQKRRVFCSLEYRTMEKVPKPSNSVTSWSWALLEKPPIVQLLKIFPAFYGTRKFNTVFTRAHSQNLTTCIRNHSRQEIFLWCMELTWTFCERTEPQIRENKNHFCWFRPPRF
jgi:hypothetical protein